jgi:DNA invertase Pin-like site-specific DNA recombinase
LNLQHDALQKAGCEKVYSDQQSGATTERTGLSTVFEVLRPGDTLVIWRLDWLGRSLKHLIYLVDQLDKREVGLKSLQKNIDTTTSGGRLVFHLFGALAEFVRTLIRVRTQAGVNATRARGRQGGRPKLLEPNKRELAIRLHRERKNSIAEICTMMGIFQTRSITIWLRSSTMPSAKRDSLHVCDSINGRAVGIEINRVMETRNDQQG